LDKNATAANTTNDTVSISRRACLSFFLREGNNMNYEFFMLAKLGLKQIFVVTVL
jgi:hypothetical protein